MDFLQKLNESSKLYSNSSTFFSNNQSQPSAEALQNLNDFTSFWWECNNIGDCNQILPIDSDAHSWISKSFKKRGISLCSFSI